MNPKNFTDQLRDLGHVVTEHSGGRVSFPYVIPTGRFAAAAIQLGFESVESFPLTPPGGPHISPRLLPLTAEAGVGACPGINPSPNFGTEWEYWSRPLQHWSATQRTARDVMAHVNHLFDTI